MGGIFLGNKQINETILNFLKKNPQYSYNAPTLFKTFKGLIKLGSIRCELRRLNEQKKITRETHGFYRIRLTEDVVYTLENPPMLLHGIMVSMNRIKKLQKQILAIPAQSCSLDVGDINRLKTMGFRSVSNNRFTMFFNYENDLFRKITITVHGNGRIDIYINCSNHPINCPELSDILKYSEGCISFLGCFSEKKVIQFGMAKDFKTLKLTGCSEIALKPFMNAMWRAYNKSHLNVLRFEQHITKCDLPVSELIEMFDSRYRNPIARAEYKVDEKVDVV